jgi:putative lipoprotein
MQSIYQTLKLTLLAVIFINVVGCASLPQNDDRLNDRWLAQDKMLHFAVSGIISGLTAHAAKNNGSGRCEAAAVGFGVSISIGASKEIYDKYERKTGYSYRDMVWNVAGSTVGSLLGSRCR